MGYFDACSNSFSLFLRSSIYSAGMIWQSHLWVFEVFEVFPQKIVAFQFKDSFFPRRGWWKALPK